MTTALELALRNHLGHDECGHDRDAEPGDRESPKADDERVMNDVGHGPTYDRTNLPPAKIYLRGLPPNSKMRGIPPIWYSSPSQRFDDPSDSAASCQTPYASED